MDSSCRFPIHRGGRVWRPTRASWSAGSDDLARRNDQGDRSQPSIWRASPSRRLGGLGAWAAGSAQASSASLGSSVYDVADVRAAFVVEVSLDRPSAEGAGDAHRSGVLDVDGEGGVVDVGVFGEPTDEHA